MMPDPIKALFPMPMEVIVICHRGPSMDQSSNGRPFENEVVVSGDDLPLNWPVVLAQQRH
jgi:hypothetical protein